MMKIKYKIKETGESGTFFSYGGEPEFEYIEQIGSDYATRKKKKIKKRRKIHLSAWWRSDFKHWEEMFVNAPVFVKFTIGFEKDVWWEKERDGSK